MSGTPTIFMPMAPYPRQAIPQQYRDYHPPNLTFVQHSACSIFSSLLTAFISRPLLNLDSFFFMSRPATDMPNPKKRAMFIETTLNFRPWKLPALGGSPVVTQTIGTTLTLMVNSSLEDWLRNREFSSHWRGFFSGAVAGGAIAMIRHPYDTLVATAQAPPAALGGKRFTGPWQVALETVQNRPHLLLTIYTGFMMNFMSKASYYSAFFGVFRLLERNGVEVSDTRLLMYCYLSSAIAETVRYPFYQMQHELKKLNTAVKFKPITYFHLIKRYRKNHGLTYWFTGFFSSHPWFRSISGALLLFSYSSVTRRYSEYIHHQ